MNNRIKQALEQPAQQEPERVKFERHWRKTRGEKKASRELLRHLLQPQTYIQDSANRHWVTWQAAVRSVAPPAQQEPVAWKLVPRDPTDEMLEAMDECSIEGYDERLYAGHAASVYMAAVDVAPTPPQRKQVPPLAYESLLRDMTTIAAREVPRGVPVAEFAMHALADAELRERETPQRKPLFKEFIKWAGAQGYDCAQTCNSDTGEWIVLNPMTADLWKAWQAAHGIKE